MNQFNLRQTFYHGSPEGRIGRFKLSKEGSYGAGVYFADHSRALEFADGVERNVTPVRLLAVNPYFYQAHEGVYGLEDFDSYAIPLVRSLFPEESDALITAAKHHAYGYFDGRIRERLLARGHDLLVVLYEDESFEAVVLSTSIIQLQDHGG